MSSVTCDDCQNPVPVTAIRCRCGWINTSRQETAQRFVPPAQPRTSFPEAKAAYQRVALGMKRLTAANGFNTRAHWEKVLATPGAGTYAHMCAKEALRALGEVGAREPGADDEERVAA